MNRLIIIPKFVLRTLVFFLFCNSALMCLAAEPSPPSTEVLESPKWARAGMDGDMPRWGVEGHLQWAISDGGRRDRAPRGLIRLFAPVLPGEKYELVNFIAVEPIVRGEKGFSELEQSQTDNRQGKRFDVLDPATLKPLDTFLDPGVLETTESGRERLTVHVGVEKFLNGAHVRLKIVQYIDAPDEIELTVEAEEDSADMEYCILTATMGNKTRARVLWLEGETACSLQLYPDFKDAHFAPHTLFPLEKLHKTPEGDVRADITCDESDHLDAGPFPQPHWQYLGRPIRQYWKKRNGTWKDDLHVAVNARYTYWKSEMPIPGGISFENFEMRERFYDGQKFIFGIIPQGGVPQGLVTP